MVDGMPCLRYLHIVFEHHEVPNLPPQSVSDQSVSLILQSPYYLQSLYILTIKVLPFITPRLLVSSVEPTHMDGWVEPTHMDGWVEPTHMDGWVEPTHMDGWVEPTHMLAAHMLRGGDPENSHMLILLIPTSPTLYLWQALRPCILVLHPLYLWQAVLKLAKCLRLSDIFRKAQDRHSWCKLVSVPPP